ncbi:MAG TPA: NAD(P)H-hydrate epimerase [Anaerolineales bacterium]|nr:NAD(P)H-hydrate epimerase [Anaerolineales bacterium]
MTRDFPTIPSDRLPLLTRAQMAEVDRLMIDDVHIELLQMMENAGRNLARLAVERFLRDRPSQAKAVVLAGPGGNGGGAMTCARRLHTWGVETHLILTRAVADHSGAAAHQLESLIRIGVPMSQAEEIDSIRPPDLIIDGLIGYNIEGEPRGATLELIEWANRASAPILALDLPSGLHPTLGPVHQLCIRADATLTLAAPKRGLLQHGASEFVGELYLADIGVPAEVFAAMKINGTWGQAFVDGEILRVVPSEEPLPNRDA